MVKTARKGSLRKKVSHTTQDLLFKQIHGRRLIYNTCWEDPRIDRELLNFDKNSKIVMITSAGCNALDYLLDSPAEVHTIDVNYRQNALLHLKMKLIERGNYEDLFSMFGQGIHDSYQPVYESFRRELPTYAQRFWDKKHYYFDGSKRRQSFYYYGATGDVAWFIRQTLKVRKGIRYQTRQLLEAESLAEQKELYNQIDPKLWNAVFSWILQHPMVLSLLGVPRAQAQLIAKEYPGGVKGYIRDKIAHVFTEVPMKDNYFWRVYLTGAYTKHCCPNYLVEDNLPLLQQNVERVHTHTSTLTDFMKCNRDKYTHFILLDHQDWLAWHNPDALAEEWEQILRNSQPGTKILIRSASERLDFLPQEAKDALRFFPDLTDSLHQRDRVGTYASTHLAEVI